MGSLSVPAGAREIVLYDLKHYGDVSDPSGSSQTILHGRLSEHGYDIDRQRLGEVIRSLEADNLIERQMNATRVNAIRLLSVGEFDDPFVDGMVSPDAKFAPKPSKSASKANKSLDKILTDISRLTLPEKLMLAGMIVDGCAGEVDETYTRLRTILGQI